MNILTPVSALCRDGRAFRRCCLTWLRSCLCHCVLQRGRLSGQVGNSGGFNRPGDSFRGWLRTITRNKLNDRWRDPEPSAIGGTDARRILEQALDETLDSAEQVASDKVLLIRRTLELIRAEFEARTWQAFWRTTIDDQRSPKVAAELGMTKHAVCQAKYRVVRRVREELEGMGILD